MYGNYPTGYSYIVISISGRPDRDGRAVWEGVKDIGADKDPRLFFFTSIKNEDRLAAGLYSCPSLSHSVLFLHRFACHGYV